MEEGGVATSTVSKWYLECDRDVWYVIKGDYVVAQFYNKRLARQYVAFKTKRGDDVGPNGQVVNCH